VLQPQEFQRLLELSGFNFSKTQITELRAAADVNGNGVIEYEEFIPVAMSILGAQQDAMDNFIESQDEDAARQLLLAEQSRPQLERMMKKMFLFADEDCSGALDYQEFKKCLNQMGLPINAGQVTELLKMVDVNQDGKVSYEEFVPVAFELLVKVMTGKLEPKASATAEEPAPPAPSSPGPSRDGWTAYSSLYKSKTPTDAPVAKVAVVPDNTDVASLEGRVLSVQCRRIIRSKIKDLFARLDKDNDGRLSVVELSSAFGSSVAQQIVATLDRNNDDQVTQYEMRRFFDDQCTQATASGVPEYKYLEGVVEMLESAF